MTTALWALPVLPAAVGVLLLLAGRRVDRWASVVAVVSGAVLVVLAVAVAVGRPVVRAPFLPALPVELAVDGLSAAMVVVVAVVALAVSGHAAVERRELRAGGRFFGLVLVFVSAMLVTVTATTLPPLVVGWEVMGACSYALIAYWWREPWRVRAANTAFLTTKTGDVGLYLAAGAAFAATGSLDLARFADLPAPWLHVLVAGVLVSAAGKSAQLPFSFWLSRAMAGPSPVSALLHSATMVAAGGYVLLRLSPVLHASGWGAPAAAWLGALTALLLGAVACVQRDLKQVLAASTCAQVGFMVLAAGGGSVAGGAAHLAGHAAVKSLLFLVAGTWLHVLGTDELDRLRGAARRPGIGVPFAVGALALAGVPPLTLWVTKDLLLVGAPPGLHVVGLAAAAVSAVYAGRVLFVLLAPPPTEGDRGEIPAAAVVSPAVLAVLAAGTGMTAVAVVDVLPALEPVDALLSAVVALAGVFAAFAAVRGRTRPARPLAAAGERWLGLGAAADQCVTRPVLRLADALARLDDRVFARGAHAAGRVAKAVARVVAAGPDRWAARSVSGVGRAGLAAASAVDRGAERVVGRAVGGVGRAGLVTASVADGRVERVVGRAVGGVAGGARVLGGLARKPQTGQLHQYYTQAVVVIAVLALVIVLLVR